MIKAGPHQFRKMIQADPEEVRRMRERTEKQLYIRDPQTNEMRMPDFKSKTDLQLLSKQRGIGIHVKMTAEQIRQLKKLCDVHISIRSSNFPQRNEQERAAVSVMESVLPINPLEYHAAMQASTFDTKEILLVSLALPVPVRSSGLLSLLLGKELPIIINSFDAMYNYLVLIKYLVNCDMAKLRKDFACSWIKERLEAGTLTLEQVQKFSDHCVLKLGAPLRTAPLLPQHLPGLFKIGKLDSVDQINTVHAMLKDVGVYDGAEWSRASYDPLDNQNKVARSRRMKKKQRDSEDEKEDMIDETQDDKSMEEEETTEEQMDTTSPVWHVFTEDVIKEGQELKLKVNEEFSEYLKNCTEKNGEELSIKMYEYNVKLLNIMERQLCRLLTEAFTDPCLCREWWGSLGTIGNDLEEKDVPHTTRKSIVESRRETLRLRGDYFVKQGYLFSDEQQQQQQQRMDEDGDSSEKKDANADDEIIEEFVEMFSNLTPKEEDEEEKKTKKNKNKKKKSKKSKNAKKPALTDSHFTLNDFVEFNKYGETSELYTTKLGPLFVRATLDMFKYLSDQTAMEKTFHIDFGKLHERVVRQSRFAIKAAADAEEEEEEKNGKDEMNQQQSEDDEEILLPKNNEHRDIEMVD
jgi:hypothetical protein